MPSEEPPFTPDAPKVTPEGIIEELTRHGIKETLGEKRNTLYIWVKEVEKYTIEDWNVYIWTDQR